MISGLGGRLQHTECLGITVDSGARLLMLCGSSAARSSIAKKRYSAPMVVVVPQIVEPHSPSVRNSFAKKRHRTPIAARLGTAVALSCRTTVRTSHHIIPGRPIS